jgi:dinuclear metal center YbgI/SA1388 family protein
MVRRDALVAHCDDLLEPDTFDDLVPNGLQVEGTDGVDHVVTGVSAGQDLFRTARDRDADLVLVHHGLFWPGEPTAIVGAHKDRIQLLLEEEINLLAYHLPLDAHRTVGNNFPAARDLGLVDLRPWAEHGGEPVGVRGAFPQPRDAGDVIGDVGEYYGQQVLAYDAGPDEVQAVGIVSGAAEEDARQAARDGLDLFVTGEASEWNMNHAREHGLHFVSAGHYATERVGVQLLADHLADEFGVTHEFVDIPNPV